MESFATTEPQGASNFNDFESTRPATPGMDVEICAFTPQDEPAIINMIRQNLDNFEEAGSVLASTYRRLEHFVEVYSTPGATYLVVKDNNNGACIGGAGIGPLAGLPASEGIGEIRDLVIEKPYRGRGLGAQLLAVCLREAKRLGYRRLYLETTPQMVTAQKLFHRYGFRPITGDTRKKQGTLFEDIPCYFMFENLDSAQF